MGRGLLGVAGWRVMRLDGMACRCDTMSDESTKWARRFSDDRWNRQGANGCLHERLPAGLHAWTSKDQPACMSRNEKRCMLAQRHVCVRACMHVRELACM
eukprot:363197-Chlamydomonas_euryale.AAC.8